MLLTRNQLSAVGCVSTDERRPELNGLHVSATGTVTASDGVKLVRVTAPADVDDRAKEWPGGCETPEITDAGVILPAAIVCQAIKSLPRRSRFPVLEHAKLEVNGTAALVTTDLENTQRHEAKPLDGRYPNCQQVIPVGDPVFSIKLDANQLAQLAKILAFGDKFQPQVLCEFYGPERAVKLTRTLDDGSEVVALLMPLR